VNILVKWLNDIIVKRLSEAADAAIRNDSKTLAHNYIVKLIRRKYANITSEKLKWRTLLKATNR